MRRRKIIRWFVGVAILGTVLAAGGAWWMAGTLLAPAHAALGPPPTDLPIEATTLDSESGAQLATWYIPAEHSTATVVLLHPIRGNRLSMLSRARLFHQRGFAVVMIDQQAHGESSGAHITVGHLERHDARAAVAFARQRNPSHRVVVLGRSLGGAAAILGSPLGIDAMILESVYPTIEQAVENRIALRLGPTAPLLAPLLLWQLGPRLGVAVAELRPIDHIADVDCPVLVMSGDRDEHTTIAETRALFAAAAEPKQLEVVAGAGHADLHAFDAAKYERAVFTFLEDALGDLPDRGL